MHFRFGDKDLGVWGARGYRLVSWPALASEPHKQADRRGRKTGCSPNQMRPCSRGRQLWEVAGALFPSQSPQTLPSHPSQPKVLVKEQHASYAVRASKRVSCTLPHTSSTRTAVTSHTAVPKAFPSTPRPTYKFWSCPCFEVSKKKDP